MANLVGLYYKFLDSGGKVCNKICSITVSVGTDDTLNQNVTSCIHYTDLGGLTSYINSYNKLFLHN